MDHDLLVRFANQMWEMSVPMFLEHFVPTVAYLAISIIHHVMATTCSVLAVALGNKIIHLM